MTLIEQKCWEFKLLLDAIALGDKPTSIDQWNMKKAKLNVCA
jgi:hypothetical protein